MQQSLEGSMGLRTGKAGVHSSRPLMFEDPSRLEKPRVDLLALSCGDLDTRILVVRQRGFIDYRNPGAILEIRLDRRFITEERALLYVAH